MSGIGVVLNPFAKKNARDPGLVDRLARIVGTHGVVRTASTLEELRSVCEGLKKDGIDVLAVAGGDGTNHATISCAIDVWGGVELPSFMLLRGGTMNTTANSFGVPRRRPEKLLEDGVRMWSRRAREPMRYAEPHILRVERRYGFIFGTGAIHGFISEYNRRSERSAAWAARVLGTAILSSLVGGETIRRVAERWQGEVRFDDGTAFPDRDYLTVGASTCSEIGLGFKPFYRSCEREGFIHVLGIHCSAGEVIRSLGRVQRGQPIGGERTYEKLCRTATLVPRHGVVPYIVDGDVYLKEGTLELGCGPKLRILIP